jgi:hypothetical protein
MKHITIAAASFGLTLFFLPQAWAKISYAGGNGATQQQAIRIVGARGEPDGVHAEYVWIRKNKPGCANLGQSLIQGKRVYDLLELNCGGVRQRVYFDITGYFGKF